MFQHIEETRCGMFEPKLATDCKVSLSEMELTRQRLVTFLRGQMCAALLQEVEAPDRKREDCRSVISRRFNACRSNKRSAESSV